MNKERMARQTGATVSFDGDDVEATIEIHYNDTSIVLCDSCDSRVAIAKELWPTVVKAANRMLKEAADLENTDEENDDDE